MKVGWILVAFGIALIAVGIYLFGTFVLATENWQAMLSSVAGLVLVVIGVRSIRGITIGRATLVSFGTFLCLLGGYVLVRAKWQVSDVPESILFLVQGVVLFVIGARNGAAREIPA